MMLDRHGLRTPVTARLHRRGQVGLSYLWVALGGALGSTSRYAGFLAGLVTVEGRPSLSPEARAFVLIGVLGGFTTFSSFSLETLNLVRQGAWVGAVGNVLASVVLCLLAVSIGFAGASTLSR